MRNFTQIVEELRNLLDKETFNKYLTQIDKTFDYVCKISLNENNSAKMHIKCYREKYSFLNNKTNSLNQNPDDYRTQPSGASGKRIGCGIINPFL
jgi:hypothetical protein